MRLLHRNSPRLRLDHALDEGDRCRYGELGEVPHKVGRPSRTRRLVALIISAASTPMDAATLSLNSGVQRGSASDQAPVHSNLPLRGRRVTDRRGDGVWIDEGRPRRWRGKVTDAEERHQGFRSQINRWPSTFEPRSARRRGPARGRRPTSWKVLSFSENRSSPGWTRRDDTVGVGIDQAIKHAPDSTSWTWSTCVNLNRNVGKPFRHMSPSAASPPRNLVKFPEALACAFS